MMYPLSLPPQEVQAREGGQGGAGHVARPRRRGAIGGMGQGPPASGAGRDGGGPWPSACGEACEA